MNNRVLIAMSGGVDSSVSAYLMIQKGYECIGATMKLFTNECVDARDNSCCSLDDTEDARSVAYKLGMKYYLFNFSDGFKENVIDRFVNAYQRCETPNPCIDCNRYMKFDKLFLRAKELNCDHIVTGHYAQIEYDNAKNRYLLKKAADPAKDQSYVLYSLTQEQLEHTIFPLGGISKPEVRKIAEENGFVNANKHDSQDICFVQNGKYFEFIESYTGLTFPEGDFVDKNGRVLGKHKGIIRYTIGQRKGLGLALDHPMYVVKLDIQNNRVILGENEDLFSKSVTARSINLISVPDMYTPMRVKAKVRYRQAEQWATAVQTDSDTLQIEFDEPQRAVTAGQAVVLYDGDIVVGGGTITL